MTTSLAPLDDSPVGVFAFIDRNGAPMACAVTPYVVDDTAVITSTLALLAKARAVRADDRIALLAGGVSISGHGRVGVDTTSAWFDANIRSQELRKYPPATAILGIPGHRRLLPWYVGRAVIELTPEVVEDQPGSDRITLTTVDATGQLAIRRLAIETPSAAAEVIDLGADTPDGRAALLVHDESPDFSELDQLLLHGDVRAGVLRVERSSRSRVGAEGWLDQVRTARRFARRARANTATIAGWPPPTVGR